MVAINGFRIDNDTYSAYTETFTTHDSDCNDFSGPDLDKHGGRDVLGLTDKKKVGILTLPGRTVKES